MAFYETWGVLFLILAIVVSCVVLFVYVRQSYRRIPVFSHLFIILSMIVCILPFPLLILDIDSAFASQKAGWSYNAQHTFFRDMWIFTFGTCNVMAWIILPIIQEYDCSGEHLPGARILSSIKANLKLYFILIIVLGILLAYVLFLKGVFTITGILKVCLACANAFGLAILVVTLSTGLVYVPRKLWNASDPLYILRKDYYHAPDIQEELDMTRLDCAELRAKLAKMDPLVTDDDDRHFMADLLDEIDTTTRLVPLGTAQGIGHNVELRDSAVVTHNDLVDVAVRVRANSKACLRLSYEWRMLMNRCIRMDGMIKNPRIRAVYWRVIRKPFLRLLAVLAAILSLLVVSAELVLPFQSNTAAKLSVVEMVVRNPNTHFIGSCIFLCYIGGVSYWATFQFKMFDVYALFPANSSAAALCFSLIFLTRLILPVCYNFLWMARMTSKESLVVYSSIFGTMDIVDILGPWFNRFLPLMIPILVVLILTKFFDQILRHIGVDRHDVNDVVNPSIRSKIEDGRALVSRESGTQLGSAVDAAESDASTPRAVGMPAVEEKRPAGSRYEEWKAKRAAQAKATPE